VRLGGGGTRTNQKERSKGVQTISSCERRRARWVKKKPSGNSVGGEMNVVEKGTLSNNLLRQKKMERRYIEGRLQAFHSKKCKEIGGWYEKGRPEIDAA